MPNRSQPSTVGASGPGALRAEALLTEREAARLLRLKPRTLQAWRLIGGKNLPFVRISRRAIRYRMADVHRFIKRNLRLSTSDPDNDAQLEGERS